jgi:DNA-binding NtrC family response regulator
MGRALRLLAAAVVGIGATLLALALPLAAYAPLEPWAYARWRVPAPASDGLLVVVRDAETRPPDAAVLARLVSRLSRAGAAGIALDLPPIEPARGGAAGEALLRQAIAQAGNVVLPVTVDGGAGGELPARGVGHTLADASRGLAVVPLFADLGDQRVPALGLLAVAVATNAEVVVEDGAVTLGATGLRLPIDRRGRALLSSSDRLPTVPLAELAGMVEGGETERLQALVNGRIVIVLGEPTRAAAVGLQAELASAVLTRSAHRPASPLGTWAATLAAASVTAWLWLSRRWWIALVGTVGLALVVTGSVGLLLRLGVVAPLTAPLAAVVAAAAGALAVRSVTGRRRLRSLEGEVRTIREALARQESRVETLEEDLDAARAAVERSTGAERELMRAAEALRAQLAEARAQEDETRRRLDALARESRAATRPAELDAACARVGIVTRDPAMLALFRDLEKAARSSLPILITGEPGTGKELFAHAAHRLGPRAAQPFVAVNMAAIPPELFESELFGHVRGSFTGAVADRKGWFEQADRGTIFLDEIGELRADHQSKLLRVLQEKSFYRVGATRPTAVDVRVVAATNRDLERGVTEGWFREDLYFRLKGLVLALPPLRARREDIAPLAARILEEAAAEVKRPGLTLSEAALALLERHDWPGNVRELQHCLRQAAALAEHDVLGADDLRLTPAARSGPSERPDTDATVLATLRGHGFDMQATARALGWDRSTVTQRLKGLGFRALVEAEGDPARAAAELAGDPALSRTVEVKLREYHEHLLRTVQAFDSVDAAIAACRRRFKNLPERHFRSLETLVRRAFQR